MTPSEKCKAAGMNSLKEVAEMTGKHEGTIINWHRNEPKLLDIVLLGCYEKKKKNLNL